MVLRCVDRPSAPRKRQTASCTSLPVGVLSVSCKVTEPFFNQRAVGEPGMPFPNVTAAQLP